MNENIPALLNGASRIAVVGLSDRPYRTSYAIAVALLDHGYDIIPVNPRLAGWNGILAWPDLRSVPRTIDIVNVFRRSEHVASLVEEAIAVGAKAIWTQSGVVDYAAAARAEQAGLQVVMDRCIAVELARL
ncbi:MAG: CoA-binding protein [Bacteroidota bacterium]|nr:CoA-binding protein [Bacteroidota bacterium]